MRPFASGPPPLVGGALEGDDADRGGEERPQGDRLVVALLELLVALRRAAIQLVHIRHPFTAPEVMPSMKVRWARRKRIAIGTTEKRAAAIMTSQSEPWGPLK